MLSAHALSHLFAREVACDKEDNFFPRQDLSFSAGVLIHLQWTFITSGMSGYVVLSVGNSQSEYLTSLWMSFIMIYVAETLNLFLHSFVCSFICSFFHLFLHSFICSLARLFIPHSSKCGLYWNNYGTFYPVYFKSANTFIRPIGFNIHFYIYSAE